MAAISATAPAMASRRAAPAALAGVSAVSAPPALAAAPLTNTNGRMRRDSCHAGTAVLATSAAVYEASGRPRTAAAVRASRPPGSRTTWSAAPALAAAPNPARTHDPTLIGEVTLNIRSMCRNRSGRPRSEISSTGLANAPAAATADARRASTGLPLASASRDSAADVPARPPT